MKYYKNISPEYLKSKGVSVDNLLFGRYFLPYNPKLKEFAKNMRNNSELAEVLLWKELRAKSTGYTFNRQYPILNYIVDFYCKSLNLVVEVDGKVHFSLFSAAKDDERTHNLELLGLRVIRLIDSDIRANPKYVFEYLLSQIKSINEQQ